MEIRQWVADKPEDLPSAVRGGFLTVKDGKVWRGAVRDPRTSQIYWLCEHPHSRPEYNARYRYDVESADVKRRANPRIWEYSALNCGREAEEHWYRRVSTPGRVVGKWGLIQEIKPDDPNLPRDDYKLARLGGVGYHGRISLDWDGKRVLRVAHDSGNPTGWIDLNDLKNPTGWPDERNSLILKRWLTACGLLLNSAWGLTFHRPWSPVMGKGIDPELIERLIPADHPLKQQGAHIRPNRSKRTFEVVDRKGKVLMSVKHRGRAVKELEKVLNRTSPKEKA